MHFSAMYRRLRVLVCFDAFWMIQYLAVPCADQYINQHPRMLGLQPDRFTYTAVIKACVVAGDVERRRPSWPSGTVGKCSLPSSVPLPPFLPSSLLFPSLPSPSLSLPLPPSPSSRSLSLSLPSSLLPSLSLPLPSLSLSLCQP